MNFIAVNNITNFKGLFKPTPQGYSYESKSRKGQTDSIAYNKEEGTIIFDSKISKEGKTISFNPKTGVEITEIRQNGFIYIRTVSPNKESIVKKNSEGVILYSYTLDKSTGDSEEYKKDEKLNRSILTIIKNNIKQARVINLATGEYITQGELAWESETDTNKQLRITKNIVTGIVVKEESLNPYKPFVLEYYEDTGKLKSEFHIDNKTKSNITERYYKSGILSSKEISNQSGTYHDIIRYDSAGKEKSHEITEQLGKHRQKTQIIIPSTKTIDYERLDFRDEKTYEFKYSIIQYQEKPNVPLTSKTYSLDSNKLLEETKFQKDGITPEQKIIYNNDGSRVEFLYGKKGNLEHMYKYNSSDFLKTYIEYKEPQGINLGKKAIIFRVVENEQETGLSTQYFYDKKGNYPEIYYRHDKDNKVVSKGTYYPNSDILHFVCENSAGTCMEIEYDKKGAVINARNFPTREAKLKQSSDFDNVFEHQFKLYSTEKLSSNTPSLMFSTNSSQEKKIIENIVSIIQGDKRSIFEIPESDWNIVAKKLGFKDLEDLDNITAKQYRRITEELKTTMNEHNQKEHKNLMIILKYFYKGEY